MKLVYGERVPSNPSTTSILGTRIYGLADHLEKHPTKKTLFKKMTHEVVPYDIIDVSAVVA